MSELQDASDAALVVVTNQSGLTVAEVTDLRRKMRAAGAGFVAFSAGTARSEGHQVREPDKLL